MLKGFGTTQAHHVGIPEILDSPFTTPLVRQLLYFVLSFIFLGHRTKLQYTEIRSGKKNLSRIWKPEVCLGVSASLRGYPHLSTALNIAHASTLGWLPTANLQRRNYQKIIGELLSVKSQSSISCIFKRHFHIWIILIPTSVRWNLMKNYKDVRLGAIEIHNHKFGVTFTRWQCREKAGFNHWLNKRVVGY